MLRLSFILSIGAMGTLLTGCIPFFHTSTRSPQVAGRVVDAQSGVPVVDAKVKWMEQRWPSTRTDTNGTFTLASTKNWHFFYFGHASIPNHARASHYLFVTHPDYPVFYSRAIYGGGHLDPIALKRDGVAQKLVDIEELMRAAYKAAREAAEKAAEDARKRKE